MELAADTELGRALGQQASVCLVRQHHYFVQIQPLFITQPSTYEMFEVRFLAIGNIQLSRDSQLYPGYSERISR